MATIGTRRSNVNHREHALKSAEFSCEKCPTCGLPLPPQSDRCLACGAILRDQQPPTATWTRSLTELIDQPIIMLSFLFLAALFLGLPFLWKSRAFSASSKWVISVLVLLETVIVFWVFYRTMRWCLDRIAGSW